MSTRSSNRWSMLLAGCLLAAALALVTAPAPPSLMAFSSDCQASPESACCTCGGSGSDYFCHPGADTGGVVCRDDGYCPVPQPPLQQQPRVKQ